MLDIFDVGASNTDRVRSKYEALTSIPRPAEAPDDLIPAFIDLVTQQARIGVNMRPWKVRVMVEVGQCLSATQHALRDDPTSPESVLARRQGDFYRRRVAFEGSFERGSDFVYGALNIGNLGAQAYGNFCVMFDKVPAERWQAACLPTNSLLAYTTDDGSVDVDAASDAVALLADGPKLITIKLWEQLPDSVPEDWPEMVCSDDDFVEVIFVDGGRLDEIEAVRIPAALQTRVFEYALEQSIRSLGPEEKAELFAHSALLNAGVTVESWN